LPEEEYSSFIDKGGTVKSLSKLLTKGDRFSLPNIVSESVAIADNL